MSHSLVAAILYIFFSTGNGCLSSLPPYRDYVGSDLQVHVLRGSIQAIIPTYRFTCSGRITQWGGCFLPEADFEQYYVRYQVWRESLPGCFHLVGSNSPQSSGDPLRLNGRCNLTSVPYDEQITVQAGDVVGFFSNYWEGLHVTLDSNSGLQVISVERFTFIFVSRGLNLTNERATTGTSAVACGTLSVFSGPALNQTLIGAPVITAIVEPVASSQRVARSIASISPVAVSMVSSDQELHHMTSTTLLFSSPPVLISPSSTAAVTSTLSGIAGTGDQEQTALTAASGGCDVSGTSMSHSPLQTPTTTTSLTTSITTSTSLTISITTSTSLTTSITTSTSLTTSITTSTSLTTSITTTSQSPSVDLDVTWLVMHNTTNGGNSTATYTPYKLVLAASVLVLFNVLVVLVAILVIVLCIKRRARHSMKKRRDHLTISRPQIVVDSSDINAGHCAPNSDVALQTGFNRSQDRISMISNNLYGSSPIGGLRNEAESDRGDGASCDPLRGGMLRPPVDSMVYNTLYGSWSSIGAAAGSAAGSAAGGGAKTDDMDSDQDSDVYEYVEDYL